MEKMNEYLAEKFINLGRKYCTYSKKQKIKIKYSICVLLGEIEKMSLLIMCFYCMGKMSEFLVVLLVLACTKHYLGGIHMKSFCGCFVVTLTIISAIIWLGNHIEFSIRQKATIYFLTMCVIYVFAPLKSDNHVISEKEKLRVKAKGLLAVGSVILLENVTAGYKEIYTLLTLLLIQIETVIYILLAELKERMREHGKTTDGCENE